MNEPTLHPSSPAREAVRIIEQFKKTLAVVVDEGNVVLGTVSDGDIRRHLLRGGELGDDVRAVMNAHPVTAPVSDSVPALAAKLQVSRVEALPVVDEQGRFCSIAHVADLEYAEDSLSKATGFSAKGFSGAVIMAGGQGKRLAPLTRETPKPMIDVGGSPLIERQIRALAAVGVTRVFITVHHLKEVIEEHLRDGSSFGLSISYIRETEPMGTAGALSMLPDDLHDPLLVINGDILTASDYRNLLRFHREQVAYLTVGAVEYVVHVPYGVVETKGERIHALVEKPTQRFLCNAGIYVLSTDALRSVPEGRPYDMTDVIEEGFATGRAIVPFPIHEYWTDIGTPGDLAAARDHLTRTSPR